MIDAAAVIMRLREIDARSGGRREAWRPVWQAEREALNEWARVLAPQARIERDRFANTWYLLDGASEETVLVGSHSDCVPGGGWLDGILGLAAGLGVLGAVASQSRRRDQPAQRTLAVVDWADEEGTRFGRSLLGSGAAAGTLTRDEFDGLRTADGIPAREVAARYGFDAGGLGTRSPRLARVVAALELHIEQGPRLAAAKRSLAAVSGCLGVRRHRLSFVGTAGHAGATPMAGRRDPVRAAARFIDRTAQVAADANGLATVGSLEAEPGLPTAVAAACRLSLDLRHARLDVLEQLDAGALDQARRCANETGCELHTTDLHRQDPITFDPRLLTAVQRVGPGEPLVSGPLHDSAALAQAGVPTAMLFVPSTGGISHTRSEDTPERDLRAGIEALWTLASEWLRGAS
ncbi:MAG: beta-ureidopropionase / N-carbamoyl-L-amino-acid hydrolase [Solirubrobacteraceae bacterium]|jgi:N-carbamoyl-L-amino-acid hydrolase|nr:beta-ureidopropionase / N-carbamoyl-L-amino-acid hydrolase [Solirubrobacteraceae bacterium]